MNAMMTGKKFEIRRTQMDVDACRDARRSSYLRKSALICVLFIFLILLLTLAVPALAQDAVTFSAEVDRTTLSTEQLLTLTLTVSGDYQQVGDPQLPLMSDLNVVGSSRSSQFSMVNGVVSARTAFIYRLQPTGSGTFIIDSATISVDGRTYQTDPIEIQVTQGQAPTSTPQEGDSGAAPTPPPGASSGLSGQDLHAEADVTDPTPFVGQQTVYRFRFYQAVNLFGQPRLEWPNFNGFWSEALTPNNVYEQTAGGRRYRVTEVRQALFPTTAGPVTIPAAQLIIPGDFFNADVTLSTGAVEVDVQPLPEDAPDDFDGAVGQFEIEAWVEPAETRVNEPVTLFLRVAGAGNVAALNDPSASAKETLADWRVYDPQVNTEVGQDGEIIRGEKLFERLLVPTQAGELTLPSFALSYFDPAAGQYRRVETPPLTVQVAPGEDLPGATPVGEGKQAIDVLGSDIRHIKAAPPTLTMGRASLTAQPLYWLGWILPLLAVAGVWIWERRQRRLSSDVAYARAQRARRLAHKRLAQARQDVGTDPDAAYAAVARALTDYVGDKFNLPAAGLTHDAIQRVLAEQAIPDDLIDRTLNCLTWADSGRFAPGAAGRGAGALVAEAETILTGLEDAITGEPSQR